MEISAQRVEAIDHLLTHCGSLQASESVCILCDISTKDIAHAFAEQAKRISTDVYVLELPLLGQHGQEPPPGVVNDMAKADLIVCLCQFSMAHSQARTEAGKDGARFLSMPLYTWELLEDPCVRVDFKEQALTVENITRALTKGSAAVVRAPAGTNVSLDLSGRRGNFCPGFVQAPGDLGSPPDIESNISPVEDGSEGVIVVDGSITCPEIGLLQKPVMMTVRKGKVVKFEGEHEQVIQTLEGMFGNLTSPRRVVAELGVGLNPKAVLTGTMLTDEGALGCIHFGLGSNYTVGGQNNVDFHLDFVCRYATLEVDGVVLIENGEIVL